MTSRVVSGTTPDGRNVISAITARSYQIEETGRCQQISKQTPIYEDPEYYQGIIYSGRVRPSLLRHDLDIYAWRCFTDVVIQGTIYSEKPQKSLEVVFRCLGKYPFEQTILVMGDRWVEQGKSGLEFTTPEPFIEMPLRYDKAYGGADEIAESRNVDPKHLAALAKLLKEENCESSFYSYPRNPAGKGYIVDKIGLLGLRLPNLEFANSLLTPNTLVLPQDHWGERPYPACFDWFPHAWFPRIAFLEPADETYDGNVPQAEIDKGILPADFFKKNMLTRPKHGFAQGAHPFMCRHRLIGNEKIIVKNLPWAGRELLMQLPAQIPKIHMKLPECEICEPVLDTVFLEADAMRVTLVWRGSFFCNNKAQIPEWELQELCYIDWSLSEN